MKKPQNDLNAGEEAAVDTIQEQKKENDQQVQSPIALDKDTIQCPQCNMAQRANRSVCFNCGTPFQTTEDA